MSTAEEHLDQWRKNKQESASSQPINVPTPELKECPKCHNLLEKDQAEGQFTFKVCPKCQHVFDIQ